MMPTMSKLVRFKTNWGWFLLSTLLGLLIVASIRLFANNSFTSVLVAQQLVSFPSSYYAGSVHQGDVFSCAFEIKNLSDASNQILDIRSSCSCVSIEGTEALLAVPIPPNGSARLLVGVEALGLTKEMEGRARLVYIPNERKEAYLDLVLKASVLEDYELRYQDSEEAASIVDMGTFSESSQKTKQMGFSLVSTSNRSVDIMDIQFNAEGLKLTEQSDRGFALEYSCPRFAYPTNLRVPVVVETSSENKPKALLMLTGEYVPTVQVSPETIALAKEDVGMTKWTVAVTTSEPSRIKYAEIRDSPARLMSDSTHGESRLVHKLIVEVPEGSNFWKGELYVVVGVGSKEYTKTVPIVRF